MVCQNCGTSLPVEARFCWNCGAPQLPEAEPVFAEEVPEPSLLDWKGDLPLQITQLFIRYLRDRLAQERQQNPEQYMEQLYSTGFREILHRRATQLGDRLLDRHESGIPLQRPVSLELGMFFEDMGDQFWLHYAQGVSPKLSLDVLQYQSQSWHEVSPELLIADYLQIQEEEVRYYSDFLQVAPKVLKNAAEAFLFAKPRERLFLLADLSLLGSCKEGFAITDAGLYWRANLGKPAHIHYSEPFTLQGEKSWLLINGQFFHASPTLDYKILCLLRRISLMMRW